MTTDALQALTDHSGPHLPGTVSPLPHVLIIGGGFAGIQVAKRLRNDPVRITLIDRNNVHLFQPLLYQVATAHLSATEIAYPIRAMFRNQQNLTVLMTNANRIDLQQKRVLTSDGPIDYDYLLIAAGSRSTYFGQDQWAGPAPSLKSIDNALDLRCRILSAFERAEIEHDPVQRLAALTFVVVGGGPTGVELAGALAELSRQTLKRDFRAIDPASARIHLIEGGDRILGSYSTRLSRSATRSLKRLGVEVRTQSKVEEIAWHGVRIGDDIIAAKTVLWAAGVEGESIGTTLGLSLLSGKRIPAQADLSLVGHPDVFVAGDINGTLQRNGTAYPGVAQVAMQQGRRAAGNIQRLLNQQPTVAFRYRNKGSMATIGRNRAIAQIGPLQISGFLAWLMWAVIHIISLVGFRSRLAVASIWIWSYVTSGRSARLITRGQSNVVPATSLPESANR